MSEESQDSLREQTPPSTIRDMGITVLFIGFAAAFLLLSGQFADVRISEADPGASFWPRVVLAVLLAAGLLNLFLLYRRAGREGETPSVSEYDVGGVPELEEKQRQYVGAIVLSVVFFFSLEWIGFLVASPFFLFAFAYMIGYRDIGKLAVFSLAVALIVFFMFRNIMNIALPYGSGMFREISVWAANLF